jgi:type II secretory pathway pseudopilin PulG
MRARLHSQGGMTLLEVLITLLVVVTGVLVTLGTFAHFSGTARDAQERSVLNSVAQREIELLRPVSFNSLLLRAAPPAESSQATRGAPAASEPLAVDATQGIVDPGGNSAPFTYRGIRGRVFRYITWRTDVCNGLTVKVQTELAALLASSASAVQAAFPDLCPLAARTKRITVVVKPEDGPPVRLSTVVEDPNSVTPAVVGDTTLAVKDALAGSSGSATSSASVSTATLNLFDSRCSQAAPSLPADHATRDTSQAGFTCTASGPAPTLMGLAAPLSLPTDAVRDYSNDITRAAPGGLALLRDSQAGSCTAASGLVYTNAEAATRMRSIHTWASTAPTTGFETPDSGGRASLTLWTSTATGSEGPVRLCVTLRRSSTGTVIGSSDFSLPSWPGTATELVTTFDVAHVAIPAGERLLLTLRVPSDSANDLRLVYDHGKYRSHLTFDTKTGKEFH